jgi:hypothetical protein
MKLGTLMAANGTPDPSYEGILTNDDNVLAVNISDDPNTHPDEYAVVQGAIVGVDAQMNPVTQDKQYIRSGMSTTKTGTQRTFKATGDRYVGDDFQDFVFAREKLYGVGESVVTDYVWFCLLNGKGEKGKVAIIANSDGSGNAGETAAVDIDLRKTGDLPADYTYTSSSTGELGELTVVSVAGLVSGETAIYVNPVIGVGNSYKYKTGAVVSLPDYGDTLDLDWETWDGLEEIEATTGEQIAIVEVDSEGKAVKGGIATVTANDE